MTNKAIYIPGVPTSFEGLLSRFLPPIYDGIAAKWIELNLEGGSFVFDPFGTSPDFTLEAARSGCKVLVSSNNPIVRFMLEFGANPPDENELHSSLSKLAATRVGDERLEVHLQQLYQTNCSQCGQSIYARAFIWDRESTAPQAKIYECNHCGDSGEHPVNQTDIDLAHSFSASSLHRMRILERITPPGDPERDNVDEALSVYLPRAIYGLTTLINRLDSLLVSKEELKSTESRRDNCLIALVLSALDKGNNLWSYPSGRPRPKQLSSSPRFIEHNLWIVIEEAADLLASSKKPVPLVIYPRLPQEDEGIILYEGPLRELCMSLRESEPGSRIKLDAIITAIPRHNQAFWTLSALWAGWIWGNEALGTFRSALRRRRYDWAWHTAALNHAFSSLKEILFHKIHIFSLIAEAESSFINAAVIAIARSGFSLKGISLRPNVKLAQIHWEYDPETKEESQIIDPPLIEDRFNKLIAAEGHDYLIDRGEPAPFLSMNTISLVSIILNEGLSRDPQTSAADAYSRIHNFIENSLSFKNDFIRYGGGETSPESAILWHQNIHEPVSLLSDRVEVEIYNLISNHPQITHQQIDQAICEIFPGMMTPPSDLINFCIESYSSDEFAEKGIIMLREEDKEQIRSLELIDIRKALQNLGDQLSFSVSGDDSILWKDPNGDTRLVFYISSTACIGEIVINSTYPPEKSIIVLPGARANLIMYKLRNNPFLKDKIEGGWRFLKFRHLRHLLGSPTLNRRSLDTHLELDPLTESPAQLRLF